MTRTKILAVALSLATFVAVPVTAFAAPERGTPASVHEGKGDKAKFPMPGAEFKTKIDGRLAKAREHMEKRAESLQADQAKELRAKFDAGAAKVNQEVASAIADGTVTKEEAKQVRQAFHEMHPKGGAKHARQHDKARDQK